MKKIIMIPDKYRGAEIQYYSDDSPEPLSLYVVTTHTFDDLHVEERLHDLGLRSVHVLWAARCCIQDNRKIEAIKMIRALMRLDGQPIGLTEAKQVVDDLAERDQ